MQFDLISDIYVDELKVDLTTFLAKKSTTLIIAGNVGRAQGPSHNWEKMIAFLTVCCSNYNQVFYVLGDHEYYCEEKVAMDVVLFKIKSLEKLFVNLKILENEYVVLKEKEVVLFGATLWSDIPTSTFPSNMPMYTFNNITASYSNITHAMWMKKHYESIVAMEAAIDIAKMMNYQIVIVTHYAPIINDALNPKHHGVTENATSEKAMGEVHSMYYTDLSRYFHKVDAWVFGHTGWNCNIQKDRCRLVSNQYSTKDGPNYNHTPVKTF
jgi:hypothetical protein